MEKLSQHERDFVMKDIVTMIINDGDGRQCGANYALRKRLAATTLRGEFWLNMVERVIGCQTKAGSKLYNRLSASDRLMAAAETASYYEREDR